MSYWFRASGLSAAAAAGAAALLSRSARRAAPASMAPMVLRASLVQRPTFRVARGDGSGDKRSSSSSSSVDATSSSSDDKENGGSGDAPPSSPAAPFHLAMPVANISAAREFYGGALGCPEGRSSSSWVDFNLYGHQLVCHEVEGYDARSAASAVDGDPVPVPHFGLALSVPEFRELAARVAAAGIRCELGPRLRFEGQPGEQWTMFFRDPSGNALEFKAMTKPENLFARYTVSS